MGDDVGTPMIRSVAEADRGSFADAERFAADIVAPARPMVLRGVVANWPVVAAAREGNGALHGYLRQRARSEMVEAFVGEPAIGGRYFYTADLAGFNFERRRMSFVDALDAILSPSGELTGRTIYMGSLPAAGYMTRFDEENGLALVPRGVGARLWLGHASNVSCHFDTLDNIACVVAGRRRFTLYPPDAIADLYVGPIDHTMAGQPVSLAAGAPASDGARFPRFAQARARALTVELDPGDALYMPKLWWHQVEGLAAVNGLVNYWWDATATGPDAPYAALLLAMLTLAERPAGERTAWASFFNHYVFRSDGHPLRHLPSEHHGLLGPLRPDNYGRLRAIVMHMLRGSR